MSPNITANDPFVMARKNLDPLRRKGFGLSTQEFNPVEPALIKKRLLSHPCLKVLASLA